MDELQHTLGLRKFRWTSRKNNSWTTNRKPVSTSRQTLCHRLYDEFDWFDSMDKLLSCCHSVTYLLLRCRPYYHESPGSRLISEGKYDKARLVLGSVTAWEPLRVLTAFYTSLQGFFIDFIAHLCNYTLTFFDLILLVTATQLHLMLTLFSYVPLCKELL